MGYSSKAALGRSHYFEKPINVSNHLFVRHRLGTSCNRLHNVVIARAAANITLELFADRMLVECVSLAVYNINGRHNHARRAKTALKAMVFTKGSLHGVEVIRRPDTFDRRNGCTVASNRQCCAALNGTAIDMNNTRTALAGIAAHMRSGQVKMLPQKLGEKGPRIDSRGNFFAINDHRNARHELSSTGYRV
jgi:hypothetical protein